MNDKEKIVKIDWAQYHNYIDQLANIIIESNSKSPFKHIFAVDNDSLFLGAHLSHRLNLPLVTDISLLTFLKNVASVEDDVLLVSNIVETGHTFESIITLLGCDFHTAALFVDKNSKYEPNYYLEKPEDYIVFPWEE